MPSDLVGRIPGSPRLANERRPSPNLRNDAGAPSGRAAPTPAEAELLDAFVVFLRTVPVYPEGHARVGVAAERLSRALDGVREHHASIEVQVLPDALLLQGKPVDVRSPGRRDLRAALAATAVSRLAFEPDVPPASLVAFARTLHENVRRARGGGLSFADLWPHAIAGIRVAEQTFARAAFDAESDSVDAADRAGDGWTASAWLNAIDAAPGAAPDDEAASKGPIPRTIAREVRRRALASPGVRAAIQRLEARVRDRFGEEDGPSDLLAHVLAALPAEARQDPEQGLRAVERILARFAQTLEGAGDVDEDDRVQGCLARVVAWLFPSRGTAARPAEPQPASGAAGTSRAPLTPVDRDRARERLVREDLDLVRREAAADVGAPPITGFDEAEERLAVILVNTLLAAPDAARRDAMRQRLVARLRGRSTGPEAACLVAHLREEVARPAASRDGERLSFLAGVLSEAGLDELAAPSGALVPEVVASVFPHLLEAYATVRGGLVGRICRLVGRRAVLDAAHTLLAPGGLLHGPGADRVLAEKTRDVLPMAEVCLGSPGAAVRDAAVRALRAIDLPSAAAVALRAVEPAALPDAFLRGLCEDGFDGRDSHRYDATAIGLLRNLVESPPSRIPTAARVYAITALGAFERSEVGKTLERLLRRRFLFWHVQPGPIRRAARAALDATAARRAGRGGTRIPESHA